MPYAFPLPFTDAALSICTCRPKAGVMLAVRCKDVSATARANKDIITALYILIDFIGCCLVAGRFTRRPTSISVAILAMRCSLDHLKFSA